MKKVIFVNLLLLSSVLSFSNLTVSGEIYGNIDYDYARERVNVDIVATRLAALEKENTYLNQMVMRNTIRMKAFELDSDVTLAKLDDARSVIRNLKSLVKRNYDVYDDIDKNSEILDMITNTSHNADYKDNMLAGREKMRQIAKYLIKADNILKDYKKNFDAGYRKEEYKIMKGSGLKYNETITLLSKSFSDFYATSEAISKQMTEHLRDEALAELKFLQELKRHNDDLKRELAFRKGKQKLDKNLKTSKFEKINKIKSNNTKLNTNYKKK